LKVLKINNSLFHQGIHYLIFIFSALYVLKQTRVEIDFNYLIFSFEAISFIFFIALFFYKPFTINYLNKFVKFAGAKVFINSFLFLFSYKIISIFFLIPFASNFSLKVLLSYLFIFINYLYGASAIKKIADGFIFTTVLVILLSIFQLIDSNTVTNVSWIKFDGGFVNPNVGPFFLISTLIIYYLINSRLMFIFTFSIIVLLASCLDFFSRTFLLGSILILFFKMYENYLFEYFKNFHKVFFTLLNLYAFLFFLMIICFSSLSYFDHIFIYYSIPDSIHPTSPFNTFNYESITSRFFYEFYQFKEYVRYSFFNIFLSNRPGQIIDGLVSFNPNLLHPFDSIFYELFTLYFFCLPIIYLKVKNLFFVKLHDKKLLRIRLIFILIFFLGIFEGFLTKLGFPFVFFLLLFLFDLSKLPRFFSYNKRAID
jgi:hypothetical protein